MSTLNIALGQFEATEANLLKLDNLWEQISSLIPDGPSFGSPPEYEELCWTFRRILPVLPAIDGFVIEDQLPDYNGIAQSRLDAMEIEELSAKLKIEEYLQEQGRQLHEYRYRLQLKRRELIRDRLLELMSNVDQILGKLTTRFSDPDSETRRVSEDQSWTELKDVIGEIDMLLGTVVRPSRWHELQRHLHFGMVVDLYDIVRFDWPVVSKGLNKSMYGDSDPIPVETKELGDVVSERPSGHVSTKLNWSVLNDESFEHLIYLIVADTPSYENAKRLMKTNAPDHGRDISVDRVEHNSLSGVHHYRTIIQCKCWHTKSVGDTDIAKVITRIGFWKTPKVNELVIATTGTFTENAVSYVDNHNFSDKALRIEMWPESHIGRILAKRPDLIAQFGLR